MSSAGSSASTGTASQTRTGRVDPSGDRSRAKPAGRDHTGRVEVTDDGPEVGRVNRLRERGAKAGRGERLPHGAGGCCGCADPSGREASASGRDAALHVQDGRFLAVGGGGAHRSASAAT